MSSEKWTNKCPKDPAGCLWVQGKNGRYCANCGRPMKVVK